jgi:hypothetical protein
MYGCPHNFCELKVSGHLCIPDFLLDGRNYFVSNEKRGAVK